MLFCERCGQCAHITSDNFIQIAQVSGTEVRYIDCETAEVDEYGDTDVSSDGDSTVECPKCGSTSIDMEWDGEEEEATDLRGQWEGRRARDRAERDKLTLAETIKENDWDLQTNEVHK
jgi:hypothetical protein